MAWLLLCLCAAGLLAGSLAGCTQRIYSQPATVRTQPAGPGSSLALAVVGTARAQVGLPYRWGGQSPDRGFDCSGLIHYTYLRHGVDLPRVSWEQFHVGTPIPWTGLRAGDLAFFKVEAGSKSFHVGIVTERGTFIHSPSTGGKVRESRLSLPYWRARFVTGRRVL